MIEYRPRVVESKTEMQRFEKVSDLLSSLSSQTVENKTMHAFQLIIFMLPLEGSDCM